MINKNVLATNIKRVRCCCSIKLNHFCVKVIFIFHSTENFVALRKTLTCTSTLTRYSSVIITLQTEKHIREKCSPS